MRVGHPALGLLLCVTAFSAPLKGLGSAPLPPTVPDGPFDENVVVSSGQLRVGQDFTVAANYFCANAVVRFSLDGTVLATSRADAHGTSRAQLVAPAMVGDHVVAASSTGTGDCDDSEQTLVVVTAGNGSSCCEENTQDAPDGVGLARAATVCVLGAGAIGGVALRRRRD